MPDIEGKSSMTEQQETVAPVKPFHHGELDQETAAYANAAAIHIDKATNRRLFWMINRRVLVCMLAVCLPSLLEKLSSDYRRTSVKHSTRAHSALLRLWESKKMQVSSETSIVGWERSCTLVCW
jgi:hypothetical protein